MASDAPPRGPAASICYVTAIVLLPLIVLWSRDNALFTGYGYVDPWIYFGYFRNLAEFKRSAMGLTFGAHLSWLLPGAAMQSLFSPVAAAALLHLGVHWLASLSLYSILNRVVGARRAFLTTMVFSATPWVWRATGTDDVQGIAIAWCLLSLALLTRAAYQPTRRFSLLAAGAALAAFVYANSDWMALSPLVPLYYLGLLRAWNRPLHRRAILVFCGWFGAGCAIVTAAFCAVNNSLDGHPFFYASATVAELTARALYPWWHGLWSAGGPSAWLLAPLAAAILAGWSLLKFRRQVDVPVVFSATLLGAFAWLAIGQLRGHDMLGSPYHAAILLPFSFLVIGGRFWPKMDRAPLRHYLLFCALLAVALSRSWLFDTGYMDRNAGWFSWLGGAALLASLKLKWMPDAPILALAGFCVFTALGVNPAYSVDDPHAFRKEYAAVARARTQIETVRRGAPIRFWLEANSEPSAGVVALAASYLRVDDLDHPTHCDGQVSPSTVIATNLPDAGDCLAARGLHLVPIGTAGPFRLFQVQNVPARSR